MKKLKRIVTYYDEVDQKRYFAVGKVVYDEILTPLYLDVPKAGLALFESLDELKKKHPKLDTVVLDLDNSYRVWQNSL